MVTPLVVSSRYNGVLRGLVSKLVVMRLADPKQLEVVKLYFVDGMRPVDIARRVLGNKDRKAMARQYIQRLYEYVRFAMGLSNADTLIREVVRITYPLIVAYEPIVTNSRCLICNRN